MGGKRQVQSGYKPPVAILIPLTPSSSSAGKLILLSEGDFVYKRRIRETTSWDAGWFDYYVRTSETEEEKGGRGRHRPFDAKWILEKVLVPRAGGYVCSRAVRLVFPILFCPLRIHNVQFAVWFRVPPRDHSSGSLCAHQHSSNKAESAFPLFRIRRLTFDRGFQIFIHCMCIYMYISLSFRLI